MGRSFYVNGFNQNTVSAAAERSAQAREAMIDSMLETPQAAQAGVTREGLENIRRFSKARGDEQAPTLKAGVAGPAVLKGESFQLTDEHTNGHGERVLEAVRPIGGGRFETVRIVEARHSEFTRVVSRVLGGR